LLAWKKQKPTSKGWLHSLLHQKDAAQKDLLAIAGASLLIVHCAQLPFPGEPIDETRVEGMAFAFQCEVGRDLITPLSRAFRSRYALAVPTDRELRPGEW
jgi:hypothetical protein